MFAQRITIACLTSKEDKALSNINFHDNTYISSSYDICISHSLLWETGALIKTQEQTILPPLFYFAQLTHNRCLLSEGSFGRALGSVPPCLWILEWIPASWNSMKEMKLPFVSQISICYHMSWTTRLILQLLLNTGIKIQWLLTV